MRIPVNDIQVGKRLRSLREAAVTGLVESIGEIGLQVPISVATGVEKRAGNSDGVSFHLVAGNHRLAACKRLGWEEIEADIVQMDADERLLWEIDENLCRADLTELERGEHLAARKDLYLRMHPETAHGGDRKSGDFQVANSATRSFVGDSADKTGVSERSVREAIRRVSRIDEKVRDRVREIPDIANSGVELNALAEMDTTQQRKAVALVESGQAVGIRDARKLMEPKPVKLTSHFKEAEVERQRRRDAFVKAWNALDEEDREWARGHIDEPLADRTSALRA